MGCAPFPPPNLVGSVPLNVRYIPHLYICDSGWEKVAISLFWKKKRDIYIFRFPILLAIWWCIRFFSLTLQSRDINGWQISKFKGHIDLKKMFITLIWNDFHLHYFHIIILSVLFVCVKFESIASLLSYSINLMALNYTV